MNRTSLTERETNRVCSGCGQSYEPSAERCADCEIELPEPVPARSDPSSEVVRGSTSNLLTFIVLGLVALRSLIVLALTVFYYGVRFSTDLDDLPLLGPNPFIPALAVAAVFGIRVLVARTSKKPRRSFSNLEAMAVGFFLVIIALEVVVGVGLIAARGSTAFML